MRTWEDLVLVLTVYFKYRMSVLQTDGEDNFSIVIFFFIDYVLSLF